MATTIVLQEIIDRYPNGRPCAIYGRSMEPTLLDGDKVYLDLSVRPKFDDIVVVRFADRGIIVGRWRGAMLAKDNPEFKPIKLAPRDTILGVVVCICYRKEMSKIDEGNE